MRYRLRLDRLELLLAGSRVSQNHWAMRLGLSRGHWSDLLSGRHPFPSAKTRRRIVEVFGVAEDDLFEPVAGSRDHDFDFRLAISARFELTSELGQGGMGTVYLANDLTLARVVALKMVAAEAAAGVGASQLVQEIALVSRLQHPNILPLFDVGERAGSPFYVMPWIRGGSLGSLLRSRTRLPLTEAIAMLDGMAAGLAHAHEHQVLHCDIKPENILVDGNHVYVMDFGIARKLHSEAAEWASVRRDLDFSAGTPDYVSPEQASGAAIISRRSDVYSLACVAYEMLAGRTPFRGENTQQIVSRRFSEKPPPLGRFAPDVPSAVGAAIDRAMALDPADRPDSAVAFVEELKVAARQGSSWRTTLSVGRSRMTRRLRAAVAGPVPSRQRSLPLREVLATVRQDLAYSFRQRRRAALLSLTAVLTLALGIGLTTAVFAVVDGVLLSPLPFPEPDRLVALQSVDSAGNAFSRVSSSNWNDWTTSRALAASAIHQEGRVSVVARGAALRADAEEVSVRFFDVLRARFLVGRGFTAADAAARSRLVVISEEFWRSRLGSAPVDGLSFQVNGFVYLVSGVLEAGQAYPEGTDVWLLMVPRTFGGAERNNINYAAIGRLATGTSIDQARENLSAIARRIRAQEPVALYSYGVGVRPLVEDLTGDAAGTLWLLMAAVGFVLLIACANLASANLTQGLARGREIAVRAALGASTPRIVRQVLLDHVMVALIGGALGIVLAWVLTRSAALLGAAELPRAASIAIDLRVVLFALLVASVAGLATGILPAMLATRVPPGRVIESGLRGFVRGGHGVPGRAFVAAEIALALVLVTGAGLLVQSFRAVLSRPLGFVTEDVVAAEVTLSGPRYGRDSAAVLDYWSRLRSALAELPGSRGAGLVNWVPLVRTGSGFIEIAGKDLPGAGAGYRMVSEGYFETLGMRLLEGRAFLTSDLANGPRVTVISKRMAERYWPGESPVGSQVRATSMEPVGRGQPAPWLTVIGVVADARPGGYESDETAEMYVLYRQLPAWRIATMSAVVRGTGSRESIMRTVRDKVRSIDPGIPADFEFLTTHADRVTASRRFTMTALLVFGGLSLVLAAIGVYGVLSFAAAQRTREMAVRAALGADRTRLRWLVLGSGARVVAAGIVIGVFGAWIVAGLARSLLFQVEPRNPAIFAGAAVTIGLVGLLAAAVPARRAARIDPMQALREE